MRQSLNKEQVILLANQGHRPDAIATMLNYKSASVRTLLYKEGFEFPTKGIPIGGVAEDKFDEILSLFNNGNSSKQIAVQLNLNNVTVSSILNRKGYFYNPSIGNSSYFNNIDTYLKAYFLGFIAADGSLVLATNKTSLSLTITIKYTDKEILEKFKEELQSTHKLLEIKRNCNFNPKTLIHHIRLSFVNKEITDSLQVLGIEPNKSLTMGNIIQNIPYEFRDAFIIGYFDGDGSVITAKASKVTKTGYHEYISNCRTVSFRGTIDFLDGIATHLDINRKTVTNNNEKISTLTFSHFEDVTRFKKCYNNLDFYLKRKYDKFTSSKFYQDQTISPPTIY